MEEENKITLNDLDAVITTKDGQQIRSKIINTTGSYTLSNTERINHLEVPIFTGDITIKVTKKCKERFKLLYYGFLEYKRLSIIMLRTRKQRIKKKLFKRILYILSCMGTVLKEEE